MRQGDMDTHDPDDFAMQAEPDPGAVLVTHLLLGLLGMLLGAIGGVSIAVWWLT